MSERAYSPYEDTKMENKAAAPSEGTRGCVTWALAFDRPSILELSSAAFVAMVQTTDLREFNHSSQGWGLHRPWNRCIFRQSQVGAGFFIIFKMRFQDAA